MKNSQINSTTMLIKITVTPTMDHDGFMQRCMNSGLLVDYQISTPSDPVFALRHEIIDYLSKNGLSSLSYKFSTMEDITSSSMTFDKVTETVFKFVQKLLPATRLVIIDPYFYSPNKANNTNEFLSQILGPAAASLQNVYILTNGKGDMKSRMHEAIKVLAQDVVICDVTTDDFHDRFWINPDTEDGIVMGTSLNGLGKKVALVDRLSRADVQDILSEVRNHLPNI